MVFKGFSNCPPDSILYLKIHGSLDWKENGERIIKTSEEAKPTDPNFAQSLWIAPTLYGKELNVPPFDEIYLKFTKELGETDVCLCIGYSFRDKFIKTEFDTFIKSKKKLFILDPNPGNIANELQIPVNISEMKSENPDVIGNFFEYENVTFLPLKFKDETSKEVTDMVDILSNSQA
jgi:hypothetical protein